MLKTIFNAVESVEYASSVVLREALREWKLNREVRLERETRFKNGILPSPVQVADGNMREYSPGKILERGWQLLAERHVTGFDGQQDPWMIRVFLQATEVFGKSELAARWLLQPVPQFEGRTSLEMLSPEEGARRVEEMLVQIDEGIYT